MGDTAGRGGPAPPATIYGGALGELDQIDQAAYRAIAATPSPSLDFILSRLSSAADHSKLWFAIAAALALKPGRARRAALLGVASIGLASATANLVGKGLLRRARPDRAGVTVPAGRKVRMPGSTSFPSGHSASAFAFATAVGDELPLAWLPLHALAAAITYSRVHTGVHACRKVRFARLVHRPGRVLGGPAARAACGGNLSLAWLPRTVSGTTPYCSRRGPVVVSPGRAGLPSHFTFQPEQFSQLPICTITRPSS